jgi:hypothetical protein
MPELIGYPYHWPNGLVLLRTLLRLLVLKVSRVLVPRPEVLTPWLLLAPEAEPVPPPPNPPVPTPPPEVVVVLVAPLGEMVVLELNCARVDETQLRVSAATAQEATRDFNIILVVMESPTQNLGTLSQRDFYPNCRRCK